MSVQAGPGIATNSDAISLLDTPDLTQRARDLWRDEIAPSLTEDQREVAQQFDIALGCVLSRLVGIFEYARPR